MEKGDFSIGSPSINEMQGEKKGRKMYREDGIRLVGWYIGNRRPIGNDYRLQNLALSLMIT